MLDMAAPTDRSEIVKNALAEAAREEERKVWKKQQPSVARRQWFLLAIMRQAENAIIGNLLGLKVANVYSPQQFVDEQIMSREMLSGRRIAIGRRRVLKPLFPGYLFARLDYIAEWNKLRARIPEERMRMVLRPDGKPQVIPDWVMAEVYEREIEKTGEEQRKASPFKAGQRVQVLSGPFAAFFGEIERLDSGDRIRILLELLGRLVPVEVGSHEIEGVDQA